jgi:hypothetical protein
LPAAGDEPAFEVGANARTILGNVKPILILCSKLIT